MNRRKNYFYLTVILTGIWVVLNGRISLATLATGLVTAVITILLLELLHPHQSDLYDYYIHPGRLLFFLLVLFKNIYLSAFRTIITLINGQINPQFVPVSTSINQPWLQALIGNAITLTPGTVTIHLEGNEYIVLAINLRAEDQSPYKEELLGEFERALAKGDCHD